MGLNFTKLSSIFHLFVNKMLSKTLFKKKTTVKTISQVKVSPPSLIFSAPKRNSIKNSQTKYELSKNEKDSKKSPT